MKPDWFLGRAVGSPIFSPVRAPVRSPVMASAAAGGEEPPPGELPWEGYYAAAGITDVGAIAAVDAFCAGLVSDGLDTKIRVFVILGAESATAKNMMSDAYHGSLVNSPTFTQWLGVRGDGATSYVSTGTAPSGITGLTANSICIGVGSNQDAPPNGQSYTALGYLYGENNAPAYTGTAISPYFDNSLGQEEYTLDYLLNDDYSTGQPTPAAWGTLTDVRLYASRTGASAVAAYRGPTEIGTDTTAAVALSSEPMFSCALNYDGSPSLGSNDDTYDAKWYMIAEGLSGAEIALLDARIVTLITALEAL